MRRGYSLAELLIVLVIFALLIALTLPMVKRIIDGDRLRDASRILQSQFALAQARSTHNGRPCGVQLICEPPLGFPNIRQVRQIFLAEVPPRFGGSIENAKGIIRTESSVLQFIPLDPLGNDINPADGRIDIDATELTTLYTLILPGEIFSVRFDHKGPWFICQRIGQQLKYLGTNSAGMVNIPPAIDNAQHTGFTYDIERAPRRIGNPLELPSGATVDMPYSGSRATGREFASAMTQATILLKPSGGADSVWIDSNPPIAAVGDLHFLVGRPDKMHDTANPLIWSDAEQSNLANAESIWVSIGASTTSIRASDNLPDKSTLPSLQNYLSSARSNAMSRQ